jgi:hypothetical protein
MRGDPLTATPVGNAPEREISGALPVPGATATGSLSAGGASRIVDAGAVGDAAGSLRFPDLAPPLAVPSEAPAAAPLAPPAAVPPAAVPPAAAPPAPPAVAPAPPAAMPLAGSVVFPGAAAAAPPAPPLDAPPAAAPAPPATVPASGELPAPAPGAPLAAPPAAPLAAPPAAAPAAPLATGATGAARTGPLTIAICLPSHTAGFAAPRAAASVIGAVASIATPATLSFASNCCAGYRAVIVAASPTVPD